MDKKNKIIGLTVLSGILVCGELIAEESGQDETITSDASVLSGDRSVEQLEIITVTGEKTDRSLQKTVSSVGVLTAKDLEDSTMVDINDAFDRIVNVSSAFGGEGFSIRGLSFGTVAGGNTSGSALGSMYIDGAYIPSPGIRVGQKQLWDVEQIEVFRGSQSTTQGRNALAGAVNVRTKNPTFDWTGDARFSYDSLDSPRISAAFGGPLLEEVLAFRFAVDYQRSDGYIDNVTLNDDEYGGNENNLFRGKLLFQPTSSEDLSALLTVNHSENKSGDDVVATFDPSGNPISPFDRKVFSNINGFENVDQDIYSLELKLSLSSILRMQSVTTYNRNVYERQDDDDQSDIGLTSSKRNRDTITKIFTQELRLHLDWEGLKGHVGGYYFNQIKDEKSLFSSTLDPNDLMGTLIVHHYENPFRITRPAKFGVDITNWAVFGELEYSFTKWLTVFGGVRYDNEEQNIKNFQQLKALSSLPDPATIANPIEQALVSFFNASVQPSLEVINHDTKAEFSAFLPKVGFTINWLEELSTSLTYQLGYRAGGMDLAPGPPNSFDPEFTTNYEFSLRSLWFDKRLSLNANVFYTDWEDQQVIVPDFAFGLGPGALIRRITKNAGESVLMGFEVEMNARLPGGLDVFAGIGHVKTEFKEFVIVEGVDSPETNFTGNVFPYSPEWTASAGFVKRWQQGWLRNFKLGMDITYQDKTFDSPINQRVVDEFIVVNALVGYETDHFSVSVFARNIFDEQYITRHQIRTNTVKVGEPLVIGGQVMLHLW
jgi:outer membrane receptor protein involved in Fe transport